MCQGEAGDSIVIASQDEAAIGPAEVTELMDQVTQLMNRVTRLLDRLAAPDPGRQQDAVAAEIVQVNA